MERFGKTLGNTSLASNLMLRYLPIAVYLILALLIMLPLIGPGYYLALDMQFGPNIFADWHFPDFYGFIPSSYGAYFPFHMAMGALSGLLSVEVVEKLLLLMILFLCGYSAHSALPNEHGSARYFAGLLYMLNPFVFIRFLAGHWTLLLSYSLWPIALSWFWGFLENPLSRRPLAKCVIITMIAAVSSHGLAMLLLAYALMFLASVMKRGIDRAVLAKCALLAFLILVTNLYWIAPTLILFKDAYAPASPEAYLEDFGPSSYDMPLPLAIATMHGFWRGGFLYTKDVFQYWYAVFMLLSIAIIAGAIFLFKERPHAALFFIALFLIAFLLAMGDKSPVAGLLISTGDLLPISMFFRDSQKFTGLLCLSYSMLGSYGIHHLRLRLPRFRIPIIIFFLALPIIYNYGFFGLLGQIGPTQYPADWAEAGRIIDSDPAQSNILVLPPFLYSTYNWTNSYQKTLAAPAAKFFSKPVIVEASMMMPHVYSDIKDPRGAYLAYLFEKRQYINDTAELLLPLNVRYILLTKGAWAGVDSDYYLWLFKRKGGVPNITLAYESDSLYLFRNELARGPFLASKESGNGSFESLLNLSGRGYYSADVAYQKITPALYRIDPPAGNPELYPYLVYTLPPSPALESGGKSMLPWHALGNLLPSSAPAMMGNSLFPLILAPFLISWLIALMLLLDPGKTVSLILLVFSAALYALIYYGMLKPSGIGALLVLSSAAALAVYFSGFLRKSLQTFKSLR